VDLLIECYRLSWEGTYHNLDEDMGDDEDPYTDDDRLAFYGFLSWVSNVVAAVREQSQSKTPHIDADSIPKSGNGKFVPPGQTLN